MTSNIRCAVVTHMRQIFFGYVCIDEMIEEMPLVQL